VAKLPDVLNLLKSAVEAGELDDALEQATIASRIGPKTKAAKTAVRRGAVGPHTYFAETEPFCRWVVLSNIRREPRGEGSLSENLSRCAVRPRYRSIE